MINNLFPQLNIKKKYFAQKKCSAIFTGNKRKGKGSPLTEEQRKEMGRKISETKKFKIFTDPTYAEKRINEGKAVGNLKRTPEQISSWESNRDLHKTGDCSDFLQLLNLS